MSKQQLEPTCYTGEPASSGHAVGIVHVVHFSFECRSISPILLGIGNAQATPYILAAPHASPALTPALLRAEGLLLELGGKLSHASHLCRELGIPCIGSVPADVIAKSAGKLVELTGSSGTIRILRPRIGE